MKYYHKNEKGYVLPGFEQYMKDNSGKTYPNLMYVYILPIDSNPADAEEVSKTAENSVNTSIQNFYISTLASEECDNTTMNTSVQIHDETEVTDELYFEYQSSTNTVILTNGIKALDSITLEAQAVFLNKSESLDGLNIGPYFIVENKFDYIDTVDNETLYIPNYTVYNAVGQNIECIKFVDDNGIIETISEPFIYGIPCDGGLDDYLKKYRCIEKNGKYHFVYDSKTNVFHGVFSEYDTENLKSIIDKYLLAQDFVFRLLASSIETKYKTKNELLQTLNNMFTQEKAEYIYEKLTLGEYPVIKAADDKMFLRLSDGGGASAWDFDIYINITS